MRHALACPECGVWPLASSRDESCRFTHMRESPQALKDLRKQWEKRAETRGEALSGVLFQSLPIEVNRAIHAWHANIVCEQLLPLIATDGRLLDLGCGYGRLSREILLHRPDISITGVDLSLGYCQMCRSRIASPTVCAAAECLPFRPGSFDALLGVTTLMYVPPSQQLSTMAALVKLLHPGGHAMFIDPGSMFLSLTGMLFPGNRKKGSGGMGVTKKQYRAMGREAGCRVLKCSGASSLTLALPWVMMSRALPGLQEAMLRRAVNLDSTNQTGACWDFHRWILLEKEDAVVS